MLKLTPEPDSIGGENKKKEDNYIKYATLIKK
jgi:hypothetical protein